MTIYNSILKLSIFINTVIADFDRDMSSNTYLILKELFALKYPTVSGTSYGISISYCKVPVLSCKSSMYYMLLMVNAQCISAFHLKTPRLTLLPLQRKIQYNISMYLNILLRYRIPTMLSALRTCLHFGI